jgi:hypothetical protein
MLSRKVLSADYDVGVVAHMASRTAGNDALQWATVKARKALGRNHICCTTLASASESVRTFEGVRA